MKSELCSGRLVDIFNPTLTIDEVAHSLSMQCRFNGNVRHFYTVAEHSVIGSLLIAELSMGDPMEFLLHDAVEVLVGDVCHNAKTLMGEDWDQFEKPIDAKVRQSFGLPSEKTEGCAYVDELMAFIEAHLLLPSQGDHWPDPLNLRPKARKLVSEGWRTLNLYPPEAEAAFKKQYAALTLARGAA